MDGVLQSGAPQATPPVAPDETSGAQSPEEIEAYWRNRVSKKDSAHAAAEQALRAELETLKTERASLSSTSPGSTDSQAGSTADAALRRQIEQAQQELQAEKAARVVDQRKAKYPYLVMQGIEDSVFASASDADLAKLNALADDTPSGGQIAPTGPRRGAPAQPKPIADQSKDELLASLRAVTGG